MEQKLKMTTSRAVVLAILVLIILGVSIFSVCGFFSTDPTFVFDVVGATILLPVLQLVIINIAVVYIIVTVYNSTVKALGFNNTEFTYKEKTYSYRQIEKIKIRSGRLGSVSYEIRIDDKKLYVFDNEYEGAKEFLYYLNAYNVPGTPRG